MKSVRTHDRLPRLFRGVRNDASDIVLESLIQHSVCFIEHEVLDTTR